MLRARLALCIYEMLYAALCCTLGFNKSNQNSLSRRLDARPTQRTDAFSFGETTSPFFYCVGYFVVVVIGDGGADADRADDIIELRYCRPPCANASRVRAENIFLNGGGCTGLIFS